MGSFLLYFTKVWSVHAVEKNVLSFVLEAKEMRRIGWWQVFGNESELEDY